MRFFFDTEFIEDGNTIDLISIGIVAEDGQEFYAQNLDCRLGRANDWVKKHVIPHLENPDYYKSRNVSIAPWLSGVVIAYRIRKFVGENPVFWAYYGAYDWIVLNQLYGPLIDHPNGWPFYCRDLRQLLDMQGKYELKQPEDMPHHALMDARWIKDIWEKETKTH